MGCPATPLSCLEPSNIFAGVYNPHCGGFADPSNFQAERIIIGNMYQELINNYGVEMNYYVNGFNASQMNALYGEHPTQIYAGPFVIKAYLELDESVSLSQFGMNSDDELTAYIAIKDFTTLFALSSYIFTDNGQRVEPKSDDLLEITALGCDRPGNRGPKIFRITQVLDQDVAAGINPWMGHYIWKINAKRYETSIVKCLSSDLNSCFAGLSGYKTVYMKEDNITPLLLMDLAFDKTKYKHPYNTNFNYLNNLGLTLSATVSANIPTHLSITSNGLDGEGYIIDSFNISPIKFYNTKIPFVVKVKDGANFSIKNFDAIPLSSFVINVGMYIDVQLETEGGILLLDEFGNDLYANGILISYPTSGYSVSSLNYTLSSQGSGGSFRGYITFLMQEDVTTNVTLILSATLIDDQSVSWNLEGNSNVFNLYPPNYFDAYKKNENFNAAQTLKDLRFQEILTDKNVLFDDFFGGILGGDSTQHEDIGVKTYEGSANFVQNTQDLDDSTIDSLNSMGEFMGYNDVNEERYIYPVKVKRLVDLLSIDKVKLLGYENKFRENFDVRGRSSKTLYGVNIGDEIDTTTYVVSASTPIVALEKFSNEYVLLNTYQPISAVGSYQYPLSSYSSDWGWPLVLLIHQLLLSY